MNHTLRQRSDLVRAAEQSLNISNRPRNADGIVFAEPVKRSLIEQAYKDLGRAAFRRELVVVAVCVIAMIVLGSLT